MWAREETECPVKRCSISLEDEFAKPVALTAPGRAEVGPSGLRSWVHDVTYQIPLLPGKKCVCVSEWHRVPWEFKLLFIKTKQ